MRIEGAYAKSKKSFDSVSYKINKSKMDNFKNICDIIDKVIEECDAIRFSVTMDYKNNKVIMIIDLSDLTIQSYDNPFIELIDHISSLSFSGVPTAGIDAEIQEAVRMEFSVCGFWS